MPLHFGKIGAAIALLTIAAFVLWLLWTTLFATEQAEQKLEQHGAVELPAALPARPTPSEAKGTFRAGIGRRS
jgi:hypothetical protein